MADRPIYSDLDPFGLHGEDPPMWLFEIEVGRQARIGLAAGLRLDAAVGYAVTDFDAIFGSLQAMLVASANISKLFLPSRTRSKSGISRRGAILRERLQVADHSPVLDRTLRNHFEHFDERLEDFVSGGGRSFSDVIVGVRPGSRPDYPDHHYLRRYDPESGEADFGGDCVNVPVLREELARLASLVARRHPVFGEANPPAADPW